MSEPISVGRRLTHLAAERGDSPALTLARSDSSEESLTFAEVESWANRAARFLESKGAGQGSTVVSDLPNSLEPVVGAFAAWKLGCLYIPIRSSLPGRERDDLLELASPRALLTKQPHEAWTSVTPDELRAADLPDDPLPDRTAHPGKAIASGGSTGRPKIIVNPAPWVYVPDAVSDAYTAVTGFRREMITLIPGPLYHNTPFSWSVFAIAEAHHVVLMEKFDAARFVELVKKHEVTFSPIVPTIMRRVLRLENLDKDDLASLEAIFHTAAPCPPWVKRGWIDLIGAEKVYEAFGSTEDIGVCGIRGDEWLQHPGSVGRPTADTDLSIRDVDGNEVPAGEVGEIFMRPKAERPTYEYIGSAPAKTIGDRWTSVGDLGWVDDEGYVYLADRRVDMIITGGANVYPAEVEAALTEHAAIADVAVIGVPDDDWGSRVHAVVQTMPGSDVTASALDAHARERIASYKVPKSYEFVDELPRDDAGKIRRSGLAAERTTPWTDAMISVT